MLNKHLIDFLKNQVGDINIYITHKYLGTYLVGR